MKLTARLKAAASAAKQFARVAKFYAGIELPVRLGVAVIADGRCRPRWYGSDQAKVCKEQQAFWWCHGPSRARTALFDSFYYLTHKKVTGSNRQLKLYVGVCDA